MHKTSPSILSISAILVLTLLSLVTISCNSKPRNIDRIISTSEIDQIESVATLSQEDGLKGLKMNCYSCHNPASGSHDDMLAPPLAGIKYKYSTLYPEREVFIAQMSDFIIAPTKENAVMKGPVRRFGLMPKTTMTDDDIYALVAFIYDNKLEVPDWFPEHFADQHDADWEDQ